eukprot:COSAG02_NODE_3431_length_6751_cov_4.763830_5_plen_151_part_00
MPARGAGAASEAAGWIMKAGMLRLRLSRLVSRVRGQHCGWTLQRRQQSSIGSTSLATSGVAALDRGFIRLDGADALPFLQGLTTNDTTLLENDQTQCQYTSLLHPKGVILLFLLLAAVRDHQEVLLWLLRCLQAACCGRCSCGRVEVRCC